MFRHDHGMAAMFFQAKLSFKKLSFLAKFCLVFRQRWQWQNFSKGTATSHGFLWGASQRRRSTRSACSWRQRQRRISRHRRICQVTHFLRLKTNLKNLPFYNFQFLHTNYINSFCRGCIFQSIKVELFIQSQLEAVKCNR